MVKSVCIYGSILLLVSNRRIIMKATKKIVCLALAIVLAGLALVMPVSAAKTTPLIIVDGINSTRDRRAHV